MPTKDIIKGIVAFLIAGTLSSVVVRHLFSSDRFSGCGDLDDATCNCAINAMNGWPDEDRARITKLGEKPPSQWPEADQRAVAREVATCAMTTKSKAVEQPVRDACNGAINDADLCACIASDFLETRSAHELSDVLEAGMQQRATPSTLVEGMFQTLSFSCSKKLGR